MKNKNISPEWQARQDWREEGVFRPGAFSGKAARRYREEAVRIIRELGDNHEGGQGHVGAH
ncbi:hypothetical protein [Halomonas mongoliensis]|uniref:hypothetical protein n=1 Tax=Halomonas mongoliensis TaxID=321265 RepID=UPI00403AAB04